MSHPIVPNGKAPKQASHTQLATSQVALYMRVSSGDAPSLPTASWSTTPR